ncbi:serine hydrolase domain-containing protein [Paraglaciecola polaris]|uniref:Beta-lactamase n=1 Tax=Paraglaciecola polaris LMG 21857 TaxID=1129793 RepID=K6ZWE1_9ALTE|nr:serine hydrolase [Paraglaciecola polaris]GAC33103.1 beta-lactamase [Paraglaciecola polaris LMG 21857]
MKHQNQVTKLGIHRSRFLAIAMLAIAIFVGNAYAKVSSDDAFIKQHKLVERSTEILFWTQDERAIGFKNIGRMWPTRVVSKAKNAQPMVLKDIGLGDITYEVEGKEYTIGDFIELKSAIGLVVLKNGELVYENYTDGNDKNTRWISFSVTKSISSLLIGAAIKEGYIASVDDQVVDYLPQLKGSAYDGASIKNVLHMNSGVQWNEDYNDPNSDVSKAGAANGIRLINYVKALPRAHKPGTVFNYNTAESNLIGELLRSAIGNNAATYLQDKIWQPYAMESDALWVLDRPNGVETGGCCLLASLRDFAKIGQFAYEQLTPSQNSPLAKNWLKDSVTPSKTYPNYGYQWWLESDSNRFRASGIFGQAIAVYPELGLVIAKHGNSPQANGPSEYKTHEKALDAAIVARLQEM